MKDAQDDDDVDDDDDVSTHIHTYTHLNDLWLVSLISLLQKYNSCKLNDKINLSI